MMLWRSNQPATCGKRKRDDDEEERLNSSFQVPSYAGFTNTRIKNSRKRHLLTLPTDVRHKISQYAIVQDEPINVSRKAPVTSKEPGLLEVSHDVRDEAIKIFYAENDFELRIHNFNAAAILPWLNKTDHHRKSIELSQAPIVRGIDTSDLEFLTPDFCWLLQKQHAYNALRTSASTRFAGKLTYDIPFEPDWTNLVAWLKLVHEGRMIAPKIQEDDSKDEGVTYAVFEVVKGLMEEDWSVVEKILPGLRKMWGLGIRNGSLMVRTRGVAGMGEVR